MGKLKDERPRYKTVCCNCGKTMYSCKSLGQETGWTKVGYGRCIHCHTDIGLEFNEKEEIMQTMLWSQYIENSRIKDGE